MRVVGFGLVLCVLALSFALLACEPAPSVESLPGEMASLQEACVMACNGEQQNITVSLPEQTRLYATDEALCAQQGRKLFCARCPCMVTPGTLVETTSGLRVVCTLTPDEESEYQTITVTC
jgi:hypothetical protein